MVSEGNPHPQTPRLRTKPERARAPHLAATGHVGEVAGARAHHETVQEPVHGGVRSRTQGWA